MIKNFNKMCIIFLTTTSVCLYFFNHFFHRGNAIEDFDWENVWIGYQVMIASDLITCTTV